jgi:hypothetical protein
MAKTKNKTKEVEYAVKYLHDTMKMETKQISLELGVAEAIVDGIINEQPEPKPTKKSKSQDLMIRHSSVKKTNNVSIMTEVASQLHDEYRKKGDSHPSKRFKDSIYRPNGE